MVFDVICVGSATIDVFAKSDSELVKIMGSDKEVSLLAFPTGSKLLIRDMKFMVGGGGTNTAVAFSRLGFKTSFLGKIGDDHNADKILETLKAENIDMSLIRTGRDVTGYSIILDSMAKDRAILTCKGVNDDLSFSEINKPMLKTKWFYFSSMMNKSFETLEKVAYLAEKQNAKILFNPSSYLAKKGINRLREVLRRTEILIFNQKEAELLTGTTELKQIFRYLLTLGPSLVVITRGKQGVVASDHRYIYELKSNRVKVCDATGAGDAFAATFLAAMIKKNDISFALRFASMNAESVIGAVGAKAGLCSWNKTLRLLKKDKRIVAKKNL